MASTENYSLPNLVEEPVPQEPAGNQIQQPPEMPWTVLWNPDTPRDRSIRELQRIRSTSARSSVGIGTKLSHAFGGETVIGELWRALDTPDFHDTGYVPTETDFEKYADDIDRSVAERVAISVDSLPEFLYELDQVRVTNRKREELFSGGGLGMAT